MGKRDTDAVGRENAKRFIREAKSIHLEDGDILLMRMTPAATQQMAQMQMEMVRQIDRWIRGQEKRVILVPTSDTEFDLDAKSQEEMFTLLGYEYRNDGWFKADTDKEEEGKENPDA